MADCATMQRDVLAPLVRAYLATHASGDALLQALRPHVHRIAGRYPHAYFEGARRDDDSLAVLEGLVFTHCVRTARTREPFRGRPPFQAYVEEEFPDPPIRYHTCYGPLSVTREVLRDEYARQVRQDPELKRRDRIYRALGPVLDAGAERVPRQRSQPLWRVAPKGPARVLDLAEVRQRLLGSERPLPELALEALRLAGQPLSRSQLSHLVADILDPGQERPDPVRDDTVARLAVRAAVADAWASLEPLDRALLAGLARGDDGKALQARDPRLNNPVQLTRALKRVGDGFVAAMAARMDQDSQVAVKPRVLVERVVGVLVEMLPELEGGDDAL